VAVVLAPVVEEVLFRGYSYLGARARVGARSAMAGVTLLFVVLHLGETGDWWPAITGIALVSFLLVSIMERTENLTHCIACHAGYNAALAGLSFAG
jgi:membrane protease YdiL (CAAX protease family)